MHGCSTELLLAAAACDEAVPGLSGPYCLVAGCLHARERASAWVSIALLKRYVTVDEGVGRSQLPCWRVSQRC